MLILAYSKVIHRLSAARRRRAVFLKQNARVLGLAEEYNLSSTVREKREKTTVFNWEKRSRRFTKVAEDSKNLDKST